MTRLDDELLVRGPAFASGIPGIWQRRDGAWRVPMNAALLLTDAHEIMRGELVSPLLPTEHTDIARRLRASELRSIDTWSTWLYPWQRDVVAAIDARHGATLWQAPGAGKTIQALMAAFAGVARPAPLVVVTRAGARQTQRVELMRFFDVWPFVERPENEWRRRDWTRDAEWAARTSSQYAGIIASGTEWWAAWGAPSWSWYLEVCTERRLRPVFVLGWESLLERLDLLEALQGTGYGIIFDEAHYAKSYKRSTFRRVEDEDGGVEWQETTHANRSNAAATWAESAVWRCATTGTAVANRIEDLWGQLTLIEPYAWGKTATGFRIRYCGAYPDEMGHLTTRGATPCNLDELELRKAMCVVSTPYATTHGHLPEWRRVVRFVAPSEQVKELLNGLSYAREIKRLSQSRSAAAQLHELYRMQAASRKRKITIDVVRENFGSGKGKIIVFTGRKPDIDHIANALSDVKTWVATGDVSTAIRADIEREYMAHPGPCVLIATWQSMGESVNLQDTDAIVWAMLPATPREVDQGEGRARRQGMARPLRIFYLVAEGTIDVVCAETLIDKLPAVESVQGTATPMHGFAKQLGGADEADRWAQDGLDKLRALFDAEDAA